MKNSEVRLWKLVSVASLGLVSSGLTGCGGGGGEAHTPTDTPPPTSVSSTDGTLSAPEQTQAATAPTPTWPGFKFNTFSVGDRPNIGCSTATNASATLGTVHFGQTHLLQVAHVFFHLSANRPTLVRASVLGSGPAPAVKVQGTVSGVDLGSFCLSGPSMLEATETQGTIDPSHSFTGTLPASWVRPGLQVTVTAGNASRTFPADRLNIGPSPEVALVTSNWLLFNDTQVTPMPDGLAKEFASKLPVTRLRHAAFPVNLTVPQLPLGPRADGQSRYGTRGPQPAALANQSDHCNSSDKSAGTCTAWDGFHVLHGVRLLAGSLQSANGMDWVSHWYGVLGLKNKGAGGLGADPVASGNDYSAIFNHEMGHTFDMPHWGDALYSRVPAGTNPMFPYTGAYTDPSTGQPVGGGFGRTWAYDWVNNAYVDPLCATTQRERQDPMQRYNGLCLANGNLFDHFSDYSALSIYRYLVGANTDYAGTAPSPRDAYGNARSSFAFQAKPGRVKLVYNGTSTTPTLMKWDPLSKKDIEWTAAQVDADSRVYGERFPLQWDVPVFTLWGSFSNATPAATTILPPLSYRGNLKRVWDPTKPADFAAMKTFIRGEAFWWGADLVAKAEYSNGTVQHALVKAAVRSTDPLSTDSFTYWAVNVPAPAGVSVTKVSLYYRPMEVRYNDAYEAVYRTTTNLNSSLNSSVTAANYLSGARLVASRTF